jgi:hypothetical protein
VAFVLEIPLELDDTVLGGILAARLAVSSYLPSVLDYFLEVVERVRRERYRVDTDVYHRDNLGPTSRSALLRGSLTEVNGHRVRRRTTATEFTTAGSCGAIRGSG